MLIFMHHSLSKCTLLFLLINTLFPCYTSQSSPPVCPYPCLPPPIGVTDSYPPPPPQLSDTFNSYPPPPPLDTNPGDVNNYYPPPPPASVAPNYYFSPPANAYPAGPAPPPPNPILPWFPFYYKNPPPPPRSSAHSTMYAGVSSSALITSVLLGLFYFV